MYMRVHKRLVKVKYIDGDLEICTNVRRCSHMEKVNWASFCVKFAVACDELLTNGLVWLLEII